MHDDHVADLGVERGPGDARAGRIGSAKPAAPLAGRRRRGCVRRERLGSALASSTRRGRSGRCPTSRCAPRSSTRAAGRPAGAPASGTAPGRSAPGGPQPGRGRAAAAASTRSTSLGEPHRHCVAADRAQEGGRAAGRQESAPVERSGLAHVSARPWRRPRRAAPRGRRARSSRAGSRRSPRAGARRAPSSGRAGARPRGPPRRAPAAGSSGSGLRLGDGLRLGAPLGSAEPSLGAPQRLDLLLQRAPRRPPRGASSSTRRAAARRPGRAIRSTPSRERLASRSASARICSAASTSALTWSAADPLLLRHRAAKRTAARDYLTRNAPRMNGWIRQKYV